MEAQATFLDTFRGDKIELQIEKEDTITKEEAKIVSINHVEPERVQGIPKKGYKSATLQLENNSEEPEIRWLHMVREIEQEKEINYGKYEIKEDETEILTVPEREKTQLGTIKGIEVLE